LRDACSSLLMDVCVQLLQQQARFDASVTQTTNAAISTAFGLTSSPEGMSISSTDPSSSKITSSLQQIDRRYGLAVARNHDQFGVMRKPTCRSCCCSAQLTSAVAANELWRHLSYHSMLFIGCFVLEGATTTTLAAVRDEIGARSMLLSTHLTSGRAIHMRRWSTQYQEV
jgi:hypothetical protein